jgi:hypothetical protein
MIVIINVYDDVPNSFCLDRIFYCGTACPQLSKRKAVAHSPFSIYVTPHFHKSEFTHQL